VAQLLTSSGDLDLGELGQDLHAFAAQLYPICRSITGEGVRETLRQVQEFIPIAVHEVATGTTVFDWTVPNEWNIRDAYIKDPAGRKIVDFNQSNLHVVSYSAPVHKTVSLQELKDHLFTLPEHPDWIPYRTSYYNETWGFCMPHAQLQTLAEGDYEVCVDASLEPGHLTYGEYCIPGATDDEVLISAHVCHPSLANDNLSGIAIATFLARHLSALSLRYSYRFLYLPGTIGPITWLSRNEDKVERIKHGLVAVCLGDPGRTTYKKSRRGDAEIDRAVEHVLKHSGADYRLIDFFPYGYDERQFCSPGFNLPVGCLMRSQHGSFAEYHTSGDNLDLIRPKHLADSFGKFLAVFNVLENNRTFVNLNPKCEPQLGKRGLYGPVGGHSHRKLNQMAMLWVLNMSDGENSLLDIAERADVDFESVRAVAAALAEHDLLAEHDGLPSAS